ncbi:hypothetical protein MMC22_004062 [Lobaria immixta]|nr:hypothetical protein [Lobaria immixta]
MAAFATITTALPRENSPEGLPADPFTCNTGYKVTCCRDPLKGIFGILGGGSGGANVAGCSCYSSSDSWYSFTQDCDKKRRKYGHCCQSVAGSLDAGGESSGLNCYKPPGPTSPPSNAAAGFNLQEFGTDEANLPYLNQAIPAPMPIVDLQANSGDSPSYLPLNIFGTPDGQSEASIGIPLSEEFYV